MPDHPMPTGDTDAAAPAPDTPVDTPVEASSIPDAIPNALPAADPVQAEAPAAEVAPLAAGSTPEGAEGAAPDVTVTGDASDPPAQAAAPAAPAVPELSPAACAAKLAELFPALFKGAPKPLKLRIQADIQQRAPGLFTKKSLSGFLHRYTTTTAYLIALTQTGQRVDLDGAPAGDLADEHVQAAAGELARRRATHEARRAAENAARREAEQAQRQSRAVEDDARRDRALLLRAFETSTLTRANFCALKRIAEPDLEALLVTARQEAAQRAQEGWQPDHHAPDRRPEPGRDGPPRGGRPFEGRDGREGRRDGPAGARPPGRHNGPRPSGGPGPGNGPRRGPATPKPSR